MRKIILDLAMTLHGVIEGPSGETDWCIMERLTLTLKNTNVFKSGVVQLIYETVNN